MGTRSIVFTMIRAVLVSTAVFCLSDGFPPSDQFLQQGPITNRKLSSLVQRYYANIKDVDNFSLKGRSSLLTGLRSNEYDQKEEKEIREKTKFTNKIAAANENFPEADVGSLEYNKARDLEDLLNIIEEIGIDKL